MGYFESIFDANILNAFLEGTQNVLRTMCQTNPTSGKPAVKKEKAVMGEVSGTILLTSPHTHGVFIILFSSGVILTFVSRRLGEIYTQVNAEVKAGLLLQSPTISSTGSLRALATTVL